VVYSTYQSVSGSGYGGIGDLEAGLKGALGAKYPHPIADNCLPHIDVFLDNGYSREEEKMIQETRKIFNDQGLRVTATAVRVPIRYCHCISVNAEFCKPFDMPEVFEVLKGAAGVVLWDDLRTNLYPMPLTAAGRDEVFVGRVRRDYSVANGINMWIVADNVRKGAATNAVQIAELLTAATP
jgi:aspartate-semialdehyde dehydrogenase